MANGDRDRRGMEQKVEAHSWRTVRLERDTGHLAYIVVLDNPGRDPEKKAGE